MNTITRKEIIKSRRRYARQASKIAKDARFGIFALGIADNSLFAIGINPKNFKYPNIQ